MRFPKPWYRPNRGVWYVTIDGTQHNLGPDREEATRFSKPVAGAPDPVKVDLISGEYSQVERSVSVQVNELQINSLRGID